MRLLLHGLIVLAACSPGDARDGTAQLPVVSSAPVDVAPLNELVEEARAVGEAWIESPTLVALRVIGGDSEVRELTLTATANRTEAADSSVVILTRDGFLDDSVRGDWHRLVLVRVEDGAWHVVEAERAQTCWRGGTDSYSADPCS